MGTKKRKKGNGIKQLGVQDVRLNMVVGGKMRKKKYYKPFKPIAFHYKDRGYIVRGKRKAYAVQVYDRYGRKKNKYRLSRASVKKY